MLTMSALLKQWSKPGWKVEEQKPQCHVCRILVTYDLACIDATILMTLLPVERGGWKGRSKGKNY